MQDLVDITVGLVAGLFTGAVTGFYFERRSTKVTRARAEALEQELKALRESIYAAGGREADDHSGGHGSAGELEALVVDWIRRHQDAAGQVRRNVLVLHFIDAGFSQDRVDETLENLQAQGEIVSENEWLRLR